MRYLLSLAHELAPIFVTGMGTRHMSTVELVTIRGRTSATIHLYSWNHFRTLTLLI